MDETRNDFDSRAALAEEIVNCEWNQFQRVHHQDGRAACQDDWATFHQMRLAQFLTWSLPLASAYRNDLAAAEATGRNLITEKYARMMASTEPERFHRDLAPHLPSLDAERIAAQEAIIAVQVAWAEAFRGRYPRLGTAMRVLHTEHDTLSDTSFETYLRGELGTYSSATLARYGELISHEQRSGTNLTERTIELTVQMAGYASLADAEAAHTSSPETTNH